MITEQSQCFGNWDFLCISHGICIFQTWDWDIGAVFRINCCQ